METNPWLVKLAAWTHDPPEKALILMRTREGHEGGTVRELQTRLFGSAGVPAAYRAAVKRADHWAAAADRPQWPRTEGEGRYALWSQVRFSDKPVLIHPLSGRKLPIHENLAEVDPEHIRQVSSDHLGALVQPADGALDARATALAFWRFGPQLNAAELKSLWGLLPADSRVPDHTIWAHLDLCSCLATAFTGDPDANPALLSVSFGPVQEFIAQARSTSDLWAGSHLLSRIAWEGLKVICQEHGPDAVIFPQLRGVPQVDLWLRDAMGLPNELFEDEDWTRLGTDRNPLYAATLPNRFVALVPACRAAELAGQVTAAVRTFVADLGDQALDALLKAAGMDDLPHARVQLRDQLAGFPEVHWACVPWAPLVREREGQAPATDELAATLRAFEAEDQAGAPGFLGTPAWQLLSREIRLDGSVFYRPNPGVLYPAMYDLLDRVQRAAKSVRPFTQLQQRGFRCSLCGERESLSDSAEALDTPPGRREHSLWKRLQHKRRWLRGGEHLCAPCSVKRLWPDLFGKEVARASGEKPGRYVVSTHTMAVATSLEYWLRDPRPLSDGLRQTLDQHATGTLALPHKLARGLYSESASGNPDVRRMLRGLPLYLESLREDLSGDDAQERDRAADEGERFERELKSVLGGNKPEAYYGLILMDGDAMGAWLSGGRDDLQLRFRQTWHPQILNSLDQRDRSAGADLDRYLDLPRPVSPARHMAISSALNAFATHLGRYVVENVGKGKLIYAGGDDLLAMVPVDDLLQVMFLLRLVYSGVFPADQTKAAAGRKLLGLEGDDALKISRDHVSLHGRLYRVMGHKATASMGAVVAHHQAPLGQVLRRLREAENRAKLSGRDAFSISLLKRSGGALHLESPWLAPANIQGKANWSVFGDKAAEPALEETPMGQLIRQRDAFAGKGFSRRAAYLTQGWLEHLHGDRAALAAMLAYQFERQSGNDQAMRSVAHGLAALADRVRPADRRAYLDPFLGVAEFLAREGRSRGGSSLSDPHREDVA